MKRQRGRGRKPGGGHYGGHQGGGGGGHNNPNRTLESNGPDMKVRGPAAVIYERYLQLARDASSSGDRVMSENYLQHAEHYFRMLRLMQPAVPVQQQQQDRYGAPEGEFEGDEEGATAEGEASAEGGEGAAEGGEQPDVEFPEGQRQQNFNRGEGGGDGEFRRGRGRGRRNRYREGGSEGGDRAEGGEQREGREDRGEGGERPPRENRSEGGGDRPPREGRRERGPRDRGGDGDRDQGGGEGFSSGPKPAFLGSD